MLLRGNTREADAKKQDRGIDDRSNIGQGHVRVSTTSSVRITSDKTFGRRADTLTQERKACGGHSRLHVIPDLRVLAIYPRHLVGRFQFDRVTKSTKNA